MPGRLVHGDTRCCPSTCPAMGSARAGERSCSPGRRCRTSGRRWTGRSAAGGPSLSGPTASGRISLAAGRPERALLVSPVLDMEGLILTMMGWAGVTEEQLRGRGEIPTAFGQTLSWKYLCWVREHPPLRWTCPVRILYGSEDNMTPRRTAEAYARQHGAKLTVLEGGEHWFHTPEQLAALRQWEELEL